MVSHEFQTPIAIINASAHQLASHLDAPPEKNFVRCDNIRDATRRLTDLIEKYLTLDRMESEQHVNIQPCELADLLRAVVAEWPPGSLSVSQLEMPTILHCDRRLMLIALRNLVANGLRHSRDGQAVLISVRNAPDQRITLVVEDHGSGIPPDELPQLFQKFFRGRHAAGRPGAGLGLYLVGRIVRLHQGEINVESSLGQGSCFTLTFPMHATPQDGMSVVGSPTSQTPYR